VIGPKGVKIQKKKVQGVLEWPMPRNVKDIKKFLGLASYYRCFIKDFTKVATLLYLLVRKEQENAFQEIKKVFTSEPVFVVPNLDRDESRDKHIRLCNRESTVNKV